MFRVSNHLRKAVVGGRKDSVILGKSFGRQTHQRLSTTHFPGGFSEIKAVDFEYYSSSSRRSIRNSTCQNKEHPHSSRDNTQLTESEISSARPYGHDPEFLADATQQEREEWLEELLRSTEKSQLDVKAFLVVLRSIANCKKGNAARRAEHWMSRLQANDIMEKWDESTDIKPLLECHLGTIQAWANSLGDDPIIVVNRAEKWLNQAKKLSSDIAADKVHTLLTQCYNAYLYACSRGRESKIDKNALHNNAKRAENTLFHDMIGQYRKLGNNSPIIPDTDSVNCVMRAIAGCYNDTGIAIRTKLLLREMEASYENAGTSGHLMGIRPNPKSYNIHLDALRIVATQKAKTRYANQRGINFKDSNDAGAEIDAMYDVIQHMRDLARRGRQGVIESNVPWNILISAWAGIAGFQRSIEAPERAENVFRTMVELSHNHNLPQLAPDENSYYQVIRAWSRLGSERSGDRASLWLDKQWSDFEEQGRRLDMLPTAKSYEEVVKAWGHVGRPDKADKVLFHLIESYETLKVPQLEPTSGIYAAIIQAWLTAAESNQEKDQASQVAAFNRAVEWLDHVVEQESENGGERAPASRHDSFLNILKAARSCPKNRPDVLETATRMLNILRNLWHHVDFVAYACLVEVALSALPGPKDDESRTKFLTQLVKDCCEDGLVSQPFLRALMNGPIYGEGWTASESVRLSHELFPDWPLPQSWTRNIKRESALPKASDFQRTVVTIVDDDEC